MIQTPFRRRIQGTNLLSRFTAPKFDLYDGTTDPMEHLTVYQHAMCQVNLLHEKKKEVVLCKMFPSSLKRVALTWFDSLEPQSINYFEELVNQFCA